MDGDCPSKHACIDQRCQNPCIVRNPCSGAQTCVVTDSLPIRTVGCVCPDGSVSGTSGDCVKGKILIACSIQKKSNLMMVMFFFKIIKQQNHRIF